MVSRAFKTSNFEKVGVGVETPKMLRLEINKDVSEVFPSKYYVWKADVKAFLEGKRKNIPIFKMQEVYK